jgi:hypothetical protein
MTGDKPEPPKDPRASGIVAMAALVVIAGLVVLMVVIGG